MPLYFKKPPGLYISSGDWNDPANWFDEDGTPVNRVPTAADNVYVTGSVSGTGVANNVTLGTIEEIGGSLIRRCNNLATTESCCCCAFGWGIMICNANAITDDDFDVKLNGTQIGQHLAPTDDVRGEFWRTDSSITKASLCAILSPAVNDGNLCGPNYGNSGFMTTPLESCAEAGAVVEQSVSSSLFVKGLNTLEMTDTKDNLEGNWGRVWVFQFCKTSSGVEVSKFLLSTVYGGYIGETQTFNFTITDPKGEECTCKPPLVECHPTLGCRQTRSPAYTCFSTLAECEATCFKRWQCNYAYGCQQNTTYTAVADNNYDYATETLCTNVCKLRFTCETYAGCQQLGYDVVGMTEAQCNTECTPESYYCTSWAGCQPMYNSTLGEFSSLSQCQSSCLERAICDLYYGCSYSGYGTTGILYANCSNECTIQSYECNSSEGCKGRYNDTTGAFTTLVNCQTTCIERYQCQTAYAWWTGGWYAYCGLTGFATTGLTQTQCEANCTIQSYACTQFADCQPQTNAGGAFSDLASCQAVCIYSYNCVQESWGYYCASVGFQVNGQDYGTCMANCPPPQMRMAPTQEMRAPETTPEEWLKLVAETAQPVNPQASHGSTYYAAGNYRPPAPPTLEDQDPIGPGTFLSKTLEKIGIKSSPTCSCKGRAMLMNKHGVDWCAENVPLIVSWLREEAEKRKLPFIDLAGTLLVKRAISLSRAAKKKQAKNGSRTSNSSDT